MTHSIISIISLVLGLVGLFMSGTIWAIVPCIISIVLGIVALTDYLAYKWPSICGISLAIMGWAILSYQLFYPYYAFYNATQNFQEVIENSVDSVLNEKIQINPQIALQDNNAVINDNVDNNGTLINSAIDEFVNEKERPKTNSIDMSGASSGEKEAYRLAISYLKMSSFSRDGLIKQLEFEGFTDDEAKYGVDNSGADWYEQAGKSANSYLNTTSFSHRGLEDQLKFDGFTNDEAKYGVDNCEADWYEQAGKAAKSYLNTSSFSYKGLVDQLVFDGFTDDEAKYGVDNCGADWYEQAGKSAKSYLNTSSFSHDRLVEQLEFDGFTNDEARYGVAQTGL